MQVVLLAVRLVAAHLFAVAVDQRIVIVAAALANGILTEQLEEGGIEVGVVTLGVIVEVELVVHTCLCPNAHVEP